MSEREIEEMLHCDAKDAMAAQRQFVSWLRDTRGWSQEHVARNELRLCGTDPTADQRYRRFWQTITRATTVLAEAGIPSVTIKSVREYPYADANVDILVEAKYASRAVDALTTRGWRRPTALSSLEQRSVERRKLKLPAADSAFVPAHLYFGLSWRHQPDIGLLSNAEEVQPVDSGRASGIAELSGQQIVCPARHADIVLHACHAIYENYRWSVGEALNMLSHTRRYPAALDAARRLAAQFGCERAVDFVHSLSERVMFGGLAAADSFPVQMRAVDVIAVQSARWRRLLAGRRLATVGIEVTSVAVFMPLIKTARWWRRGRSRMRG